jgi:RNA polymerase sigma-70 factor (ECF subfamily)
MTDEESLVSRAAKGDEAAFETLVLTYQDRVYTYALRMTGNPEDALDISQEAFLRVYRALPKFRGGAKFSTWLYRIVSNLCIDFARRGKNTAVLPLVKENDSGDESELDIPDTAGDPEALVEQAELERAVQDALSQLSAEHREIFILREISGMSYDEISDMLSLPVGTVKSRLNRAKESLAKAISTLWNFSGRSPSNFPKGGDRQ